MWLSSICLHKIKVKATICIITTICKWYVPCKQEDEWNWTCKADVDIRVWNEEFGKG